MTEEGLNSAMLRLQSLALETYGMIKDIYRKEQEVGDVDKLSNLAMKLANYEGALITLRQYASSIKSVEPVYSGSSAPEPEEEPADDSESVITEEMLEKMSESFKRSLAHKRVGVEEIDES